MRKKVGLFFALFASVLMLTVNGKTVLANAEFSDGNEVLEEESQEIATFNDGVTDKNDIEEDEILPSEDTQEVMQASSTNERCELNQYYNIVDLRYTRGGNDYGYHYSASIPEDGRIRIMLEDCCENMSLSKQYFIFGNSLGYQNWYYTWWNVGMDTYDSGWITVHAGEISGRLIDGDYYKDNVNKEAKIIIKYESQDMYQGEKEPNNTYDTANVIQPNTTYEGNCTPRQDVDIYKFYMEQPGLAVIDIKNLRGDNSTTSPKIYEEDEHENVYLITGATNKRRLRLPAGAYYIEMTTTMQYSLRVDLTYESADEYEQENNNVRSLANKKQINTWYTGNLNTGKDIDFYKFELKKAGNAKVEFKVPRQSSDNSLVATLYDKDMKELAHVSNTTNPYATTEEKKYPAGVYYVTVKSPYSKEFEPGYSICFSQEEYKYVKQIILPDSLTINAGKKYTLTPQILPSDAANPKLTWSSSDSSVATVNSSGVISAKRAGTAIITAKSVDGSEVEGSVKVSVEAAKIDISNVKIILDSAYSYNGKAVKPDFSIEIGNEKLVKDQDYTVSYENNSEIGTALMVVTGIGNYTGTIEESFDIVPQDVKIISVKTAGKKKLKISWKKVSGVNGYILYRSTSKYGDYKQIKIIKNSKTVSYTNTSLKDGKKYYYMVGAYKIIDDEVFSSQNCVPKGNKTLGTAQKINVAGTYRGSATITVYKSGNNYYAKAYGRGGKMNTTVRLYSYSGGYKAYYSGSSDVFFTISNISSSKAKITFPYVSEFNGWYSR